MGAGDQGLWMVRCVCPVLVTIQMNKTVIYNNTSLGGHSHSFLDHNL